MELEQKTVLVTGASRGIGAAIARIMAKEGAEIILHFNKNVAAAEAVAAEIGDRAVALLAADLSLAGEGSRLFEAAREKTGPIDVVVNNAAIMPSAGVDATDADWARTWSNVIQTNLIACADLCRAAIRHFRETGGGKIINIASRAAHRGDAADYLHYGASKGGLVALTKGIARAYAKEGIYAFSIAPGFTKTEMARGFVAEHGEAAAVADIPIGEMADPDEIGALCAFLARDAVRHMTGATFDVNGASYVR